MPSDAARPALNGADVSIGLATPNEFAEVRALIEDGLARRWGARNEPLRNRDLVAFAATYGAAPIVVAKSADGRIVGCGILIDESPGVARIVRMSVAHDRQRRGIGARVLTELVSQARARGYAEIVLETTETWDSAVAFYRQHGFVETDRADGDIHFHYPLDAR